MTDNIGDPIKEDEVILECNKHGIDEKHTQNFVRKYEIICRSEDVIGIIILKRIVMEPDSFSD